MYCFVLQIAKIDLRKTEAPSEWQAIEGTPAGSQFRPDRTDPESSLVPDSGSTIEVDLEHDRTVYHSQGERGCLRVEFKRPLFHEYTMEGYIFLRRSRGSEKSENVHERMKIKSSLWHLFPLKDHSFLTLHLYIIYDYKIDVILITNHRGCCLFRHQRTWNVTIW